jgi:hypothetical protein
LETFEAHFEELFLSLVGVSREFSGDVDGCASRNKVEYRTRDQLVGEDKICGKYGFVSSSSEKIRIPWP